MRGYPQPWGGMYLLLARHGSSRSSILTAALQWRHRDLVRRVHSLHGKHGIVHTYLGYGLLDLARMVLSSRTNAELAK